MRKAVVLVAASVTLLAAQSSQEVPAPQAETAAAPPTSAAPKEEVLRLEVNWPSGLSLGEGQISSTQEGAEWKFSASVDAALPGFPVSESATSRAAEGLCSVELRKEATRGKKTIDETTRFDQDKLTAVRQTANGGKTDFAIAACARDALTFLQHLRQELKSGRIPSQQTVYYGAGYQTRVVYVGTARVEFGETAVDADKLEAHVKGPASDFVLELVIARDEARTPVSMRFPLKMGLFRVEFSR
jgi:hypothetical protein